MNLNQLLISKAKNLRLRSTPNAGSKANILKELKEGQEMRFVDGPWIKVKVGNTEGWVHADYVMEGTEKPEPKAAAKGFTIGVPNLWTDAQTIHVRETIGDEYGCGKEKGASLQCTEYVTYRAQTKLGVTISWPVKSGRNGGKWGSIFQKYGTYAVAAAPTEAAAMSFTTGISGDPKVNEIGHVAFVEKVFPDESIKISEANWPRNGMYNERILTKQDWKNKYKAQFVQFL